MTYDNTIVFINNTLVKYPFNYQDDERLNIITKIHILFRILILK